jgi:hypothetical protein
MFGRAITIRLEPAFCDTPPPWHCVLCVWEVRARGETVPVVCEDGRQVGLACYQCAADHGTGGAERLRRGRGG